MSEIKPYVFSSDTCKGFRLISMLVFEEFIGKSTRYLEVGVFEGMSGCWMLDNVLTHPESTYTGIDQRPEEIPGPNLKLHGWPSRRVRYIRGNSAQVLDDLFLFKEKFEAIYVDGDHRQKQASIDVTCCWDLLVPGGVMLVDDYLLTESSLDPLVKFGVKPAVDEFLTSLQPGHYEIIYSDYQIAIRRLV